MTLQNALRQATTLLAASSQNPRLDAEILLAQTLQKPRSYLIAWPEYSLPDDQNVHFQMLLERRLKGEPIAHILGKKEFWSLTLEVTSDTLVPRPETELLVELALKTLPTTLSQTVADLGTGTGAIALAIAVERPHWQVIATDNYPATLAVAQRNAKTLGLSNIQFYQGDWCEALPPQKLDAILSNPPYIAASDVCLDATDLSFEPQHALISGETGFDALQCIIDQAKMYLVPNGWLFLEHGFEQGVLVQRAMERAGYKNISTWRDLSEHPRVTLGQTPIIG
jgi:release factor glutamine methyltransferase